ncbi:MAG: rhamnulokinase [Phycisphaeraceae bacterium]|nr:rhamnulokinase [Phycisphaeraceae bacterium]
MSMDSYAFAAMDLGAESGRAMLIAITDSGIELHECRRFANQPLPLPSGWHWNTTGLFAEILEGLKACDQKASEMGRSLVSVGVDTWGVDFGFLSGGHSGGGSGGNSGGGSLVGLPRLYRDPSHGPAMERVLRRIEPAALYARTGIQLLSINTLFQLEARRIDEPALLKAADHLLNTPDLFHFLLSGRMHHEATIASTTQMVDPRTGDWDRALLKMLDLPDGLLGAISPAGTKIGPVRDELCRHLGIGSVEVVLPGSHDTASAVAAVPVDESLGSDSWAYLSSGTWSLLGVELEAPVLSEASMRAGFTNERGVGGRIRYLKNIAGLWLVQEVKRDLERQGQVIDYPELTRRAGEAEAFRTLLNPAHGAFAQPGGMIAKLEAYATQTGQPMPDTPGRMVRCCLESLALCYRKTLEDASRLTGRSINRLHVVGGGGRNELLNQLTADLLGIPVMVGPYEATAIGNALTQAMAFGVVDSLESIRKLVRRSTPIRTWEPSSPPAALADVLVRYERLPA